MQDSTDTFLLSGQREKRFPDPLHLTPLSLCLFTYAIYTYYLPLSPRHSRLPCPARFSFLPFVRRAVCRDISICVRFTDTSSRYYLALLVVREPIDAFGKAVFSLTP